MSSLRVRKHTTAYFFERKNEGVGGMSAQQAKCRHIPQRHFFIVSIYFLTINVKSVSLDLAVFTALLIHFF